MSYGGGGSSSSVQNAFEPWTLPLFRGEVMPYASKLLGTADITGGPLRKAAEGQYMETLSGKYLDPSSNPNLAATAAAIKSNSQQALDSAIASVNRGGQRTGSLLSSKSGQAQGEQIRRSQQDLTNALTSLYGQNYAQERARQVATAGQAEMASQLDINKLLQFLNILKGGSAASSSSTGPTISIL